jgi:hypothetical protein
MKFSEKHFRAERKRPVRKPWKSPLFKVEPSKAFPAFIFIVDSNIEDLVAMQKTRQRMKTMRVTHAEVFKLSQICAAR